MLAHFPRADIVPLELQQHVQVADDDFLPFLNGRPRQDGSRLQILGQLAENPGIALGSPAHHHRLAACHLTDFGQILHIPHITVGYHGNPQAGTHLADNSPVRLIPVELLPGPAMDSDSGNPGLLGKLRHLHDVDMLIIPADAHLDRHRHVHRCHQRLQHPVGILRIFQHGGAFMVLHHLGSRAAHIEVKDISTTQACHILCCPGHAVRLRPKKLHGHRTFLRLRLQHIQGMLVAIINPLIADHLRIHQWAAHLPCQYPVRRIGHPCHRCQKHRICKLKITYPHH